MTREEAIAKMVQAATEDGAELLRGWRRKDEFRWEVKGVVGPNGIEPTAYVRDSDVPPDKLQLLRRCLGETT